MKEAFGKRSFVFGVAVDDYNFTDRNMISIMPSLPPCLRRRLHAKNYGWITHVSSYRA